MINLCAGIGKSVTICSSSARWNRSGFAIRLVLSPAQTSARSHQPNTRLERSLPCSAPRPMRLLINFIRCNTRHWPTTATNLVGLRSKDTNTTITQELISDADVETYTQLPLRFARKYTVCNYEKGGYGPCCLNLFLIQNDDELLLSTLLF